MGSQRSDWFVFVVNFGDEALHLYTLVPFLYMFVQTEQYRATEFAQGASGKYMRSHFEIQTVPR